MTCSLAFIGPKPKWTFCVKPRPSDAGACALAGQPCAFSKSAGMECCLSQSIVPGTNSLLDCEPDSATGPLVGHCRAQLGEPCSSSDQCFQGANTPDDKPSICAGSGATVCCTDVGNECFNPMDYPGKQCCDGYSCVPDSIGGDGSTYWCQ